jgi:hypothetical protein
VAAGLVALGTFTAVPAAARHDARGDGSDLVAHWYDGGEHRTSGDPVVNFHRNALFTCFGGFGGTPTGNTANVSATLTTIKAVVTDRSNRSTRTAAQVVVRSGSALYSGPGLLCFDSSGVDALCDDHKMLPTLAGQTWRDESGPMRLLVIL